MTYARRDYLKHLEEVAQGDVAGLMKAEKSYGDSWKRRGGVGAFMMLARKWDRLENALQNGLSPEFLADLRAGAKSMEAKLGGRAPKEELDFTIAAHLGNIEHACCGLERPPYDIFAAATADQRSEGIIDDIRDLRRYLMLVEAELRARGINPGHRDNQ